MLKLITRSPFSSCTLQLCAEIHRGRLHKLSSVRAIPEAAQRAFSNATGAVPVQPEQKDSKKKKNEQASQGPVINGATASSSTPGPATQPVVNNVLKRKDPPGKERIASFMSAFAESSTPAITNGVNNGLNRPSRLPVRRESDDAMGRYKGRPSASSSTSTIGTTANNAKLSTAPLQQKKLHNEQNARNDVRSDMQRAITNKQPDAILASVAEARRKSIELTTREISAVLWACEQLPAGDTRSEFAVWAYYAMRKQSTAIPTEVYERVAAVCARCGDSKTALQLSKDAQEGGFIPTEKFLTDVVTAVAADHTVQVSILDEIYKKFIEHAHKSQWKGSASMYSQVAGAYSRARQVSQVLSVLKRMTGGAHEPSLALCVYLLENAIFYGQSHVEVLRVLSTWCLMNFKVKLDRGVLDRMLQLACTASDEILAQTCIQLLMLGGYEVRPADYACWLRACIHKEDLVGAVEALISAETQGVDLLVETPTWGGGQRLQEEIAHCLMKRGSTIDNVYFALVDLVRGNYKVPRIMLHAIIMASGYLGLQDRAFATFQELESLFAVERDVHTYNALLWANAKCLPKDSRLSAIQAHQDVLLQIMQNMEEVGHCTPNGTTFDILLTFLAESSHTRFIKHMTKKYDVNAYSSQDESFKHTPIAGLDGLLNHVRENNLVLTARTLRRVARASMAAGNSDQAEAAVRMLVSKCGQNNIPKFFQKQMERGSKEVATVNKDVAQSEQSL